MKHDQTLGLLSMMLLVSACGSSKHPQPSQSSLVHLDAELAHAEIASAPAPAAAREKRTWSFAEPRPEWRALSSATSPGLAGVELKPLKDCVRLALSEPEGPHQGMLLGGMAVDVPESPLTAWTGLLVRARSHARMSGIAAACNVDAKQSIPRRFGFFGGRAGTSPVFNDGSVQEYLLPLFVSEQEGDAPPAKRSAQTIHSVGLFASAPQPADLEILSIALVARGEPYLEDTGVRSLTRDSFTRRAIFAHAPAKLAFHVHVPDDARFDVGLTCLEGESITYRATVKAGTSEAQVLASDTIDDAEQWQQRSFDLSKWAGKDVELALEASSETPGAVAFWGAPIVSSRATPKHPNVIFYVIDGGGADLMSVYGYNRRTTPFLERLAKEGVVFEHAHSNSTWTQPSTASFMTSLQHSVLGGLRRGVHSTPVPSKAVTMAEHMRLGGYETAVFTSNPNCARVIGLERGVDVMRDVDTEDTSNSSPELHDRFRKFRSDYPGHPFWVHFQTTDVHEPNEPPSPFAGLFVTPAEHRQHRTWNNQLFEKAGEVFGTTSIVAFYDIALKRAEIDRHDYYNISRGLYDETMAHQDRELERFVDRLKADGEWDNTIFVIAADHGHPAGTFARWGRGLIEPQPEGWQGALFDSYSTHVPLIFVWPRGIQGGRRFAEPVSMIDVLPTILDLAGLPAPEVLQGRSLAPLLRGKKLESRPVILDEFRVDEATGQMVGNIETIDGRWGASLEIAPVAEGADALHGRHAFPAGGRWGAVHPFFPDATRLLLYDLSTDPFATRAVNDGYPDLVERYRKSLTEQWRLHQALATRFTAAGDRAIDPETARQLQTLGYTR
ncbi:MAG TPA: sulfatase [Planctomycetota bacterium]|jgi:arylsulfatase A-like enzyme|nr:sulfatase [Planctomycetota bacterium]